MKDSGSYEKLRSDGGFQELCLEGCLFLNDSFHSTGIYVPAIR